MNTLYTPTTEYTTPMIVQQNNQSKKVEMVLNQIEEGPPNATDTLNAIRMAARKTIHVATCGRTAETPVNVLRNPSSFSGIRAGSERPASRNFVLMYRGA